MFNEWNRFVEACVNDQPAARRMLAAKPALLESRGSQGETALHWLAVESHAEGHEAAVAFLLQCGADPHAKSDSGDPVLTDACSVGTLGVVELLLRAGADPNIRRALGESAMTCATWRGSAALASRLLAYGAREDVEAIHRAAFNGNVEVLEVLLERGWRADALKDDLSIFHGLPESQDARAAVVELLAKHGITPRSVYELHKDELCLTFEEWLE